MACEQGALLHGGALHLHARMSGRKPTSGMEALWLLTEVWNGDFHRVSWPLQQIMQTS